MPMLAARLELSSGLGWHGPFKTHQEAVQYYNANKGSNPGWKAPTNVISETIDNAVDSAGDRILGKYNLDGWFIRIGEILLGLILIGVGLAKLTGTTNFIAKAAKVAIP